MEIRLLYCEILKIKNDFAISNMKAQILYKYIIFVYLLYIASILLNLSLISVKLTIWKLSFEHIKIIIILKSPKTMRLIWCYVYHSCVWEIILIYSDSIELNITKIFDNVFISTEAYIEVLIFSINFANLNWPNLIEYGFLCFCEIVGWI